MNRAQPLKVGDKLFVTTGKHSGKKGTIEAPSATRGQYICKLEPNEIVVLNTSEFVRNSVKVERRNH